jgi:hypothetical protein
MCDRVVLRIEGLPDTMLSWGSVEDIDVLQDGGIGLDENGIYIERAGSSLRVAGSSSVTATPLATALPEFDCAALPDPAEDEDADDETEP